MGEKHVRKKKVQILAGNFVKVDEQRKQWWETTVISTVDCSNVLSVTLRYYSLYVQTKPLVLVCSLIFVESKFPSSRSFAAMAPSWKERIPELKAISLNFLQKMIDLILDLCIGYTTRYGWRQDRLKARSSYEYSAQLVCKVTIRLHVHHNFLG